MKSRSYRHVQWVRLDSGEAFGVSLWPPEIAEPCGEPPDPLPRPPERVRLLVFESGSWSATVRVHKPRLADFSRDEIVRLYRWLRDGSRQMPG